MFEHNMRESLNGVVEISVASPSTFRDLLLFVYSEVANLSPENVFDLYTLSDKYCVTELKEQCRSFMGRFLSVHTVCDVILLAEKYDEVQLKDSAEKYFARNVAKVMESDHWKTLEQENYMLVIQLLK